MKDTEIRSWARSLLRDLQVQPPLDIPHLCEVLGRHRGRPIQLLIHPLVVPGPFGMWFQLKDRDVIVCQEHTSPVHRAHVQAHELGHILIGHTPDEIDQDEAAASLRAIFGQDLPTGRQRTCYDGSAERQAELVATTFLEWASVLDRLFPRGGSASDTRDLDNGLAARLGWL